MAKNNTVKKVTKRFSNFSKEELWLQSMLNEGWILKSYDSEDMDDCQYVFERIQYEEHKNITYKIDYRELKKGEYEEYKGIFTDAGWTLLSKNSWYSKHIFYTTSSNPQSDIFSDQDSYREREKRRMSSSLVYIIISSFMFAVLIVLYTIYERSAFLGVGIMTLFFAINCTIDYFRHKKVYNSLLVKEVEI
ncbi:DUF2812 domain-containing protein [Sporosarcina thermotolerans]|uniref:DUF2812 domain-containing protein n=1 Tax=Sporosarcina thermotolerans TaxID=633404 RepID=A0AAW9AAP7_9BACL|nr:DUF2812 domain-containing protein [Sporosarcina thermotolerans]MDW0117465.1 DUF2812 domain-containing protein [Sporosarcina thermotolerans]